MCSAEVPLFIIHVVCCIQPGRSSLVPALDLGGEPRSSYITVPCLPSVKRTRSLVRTGTSFDERRFPFNVTEITGRIVALLNMDLVNVILLTRADLLEDLGIDDMLH